MDQMSPPGIGPQSIEHSGERLYPMQDMGLSGGSLMKE